MMTYYYSGYDIKVRSAYSGRIGTIISYEKACELDQKWIGDEEWDLWDWIVWDDSNKVEGVHVGLEII